MNIESAFDGLEPEVLDRIASRRDALKSAGGMGAGLALASVPVALAMMAKSAFAGNHLPQQVVSVLNFALTLEELEREFYTRGLAATGLIPAGVRNLFGLIQQHETSHVQVLRGALGTDAIAKPTFDFTAGGALPDVFTNYATFLTLATAFEDLGVRAYKGQAPRLLGSPVLLTALRIHSVEARHASAVRRLAGGYAQEGWIPDGQFGAPAAVQPVYEGEGQLSQLGVFLPNVVSRIVGDLQIAASFDEPLTMQQVLNIAGAFVVQSATLDFSNVFGVLNYAYALEQLEAAFYIQVMNTPFTGMTADEATILRDIRDHEIAHREFFQAKIREQGGTPIGMLSFDFSRVNFSSRDSVLQTAQAFEDLGVSAYNGAASLIEVLPALMAAGEIVSVEARHASVIRDLLRPKTGFFAPFAFDQALPPSVVLPQVQPFVRNEITVRNLRSS